MKREPENFDGVQENAYYLRISAKLRTAKYLLLFLMIATAVLVLFAYRSNITYDNLRYLLRDMDEAGNAGARSDTVYYAPESSNFYLNFRGDVAVCSKNGVSLHRALGGRSFEDKVRFTAPVAEASSKYMIVYDVGGTAFYLYNSLSRVYEETIDFPIYDGAVARDGSFAVLLKNRTGGFLIRLYDRNFKLVGELTRSGYVTDIAFGADGRLLICECAEEGGGFTAVFSAYKTGGETLDFSVSAEGFPLLCGGFAEEFYLLLDHSLIFYSSAGEKSFSTSFGTSEILRASASDTGICVYVQENVSGAQCGVYAFFADCCTFAFPAERGASDVLLTESGRAYLLYDGVLMACTEAGVRTEEIPLGGRALLAGDGDSVLVCYDDYAKSFAVK